MKNVKSLILLLFLPLMSFGQSIKDLDFLIGTWDLKEVIFPGTNSEWVETGTRTCDYYLQDTYIKCESNST